MVRPEIVRSCQSPFFLVGTHFWSEPRSALGNYFLILFHVCLQLSSAFVTDKLLQRCLKSNLEEHNIL